MTAKSRPFHAIGAAAKLMESRDPEVLLSGPAGTGKSRACLEKVHAICRKYPRARCLVVRKTRSSLTESGLVTYEDKVLSPGSAIKANSLRRVRQSYRYPNGSEIVVGGLDKATRIMSTEFDIIYAQEAIELTETDWESLTTRLRNGRVPYQQILADTNPDGPYHWLKQRCDRGSCRMFESRHEDNPTVWDAERGRPTPRGEVYLAKLDALTGVRKERLRYGRWVAAEGLVYGDFDAAIHVLARFDIPASWPRYRSIDFGYTNPFVCQWWAEDDDGRLYLYREIYHTKRLVSDHAEQIKALTGDEKIRADIADHDAEDRATLRRSSILTRAADKAVMPGIQAVQTRLRMDGDGKPRLFIIRDSLVERDEDLEETKKPCCTLDEFPGYVWEKDVEGKPNKESPLKLNDHGMDSMRYITLYRDGRKQGTIR